MPAARSSSNAADRLGERHVRVELVGQVEIDALDAEPLEARLELPGDPLGREPVSRRPASIGLNVLVVIVGRTPRARIQSPIIRSLRPPPYASAVSKWSIPCSQAASISANASSRLRPCPNSSGAEPTPPKFPQPSATRGNGQLGAAERAALDRERGAHQTPA